METTSFANPLFRASFNSIGSQTSSFSPHPLFLALSSTPVGSSSNSNSNSNYEDEQEDFSDWEISDSGEVTADGHCCCCGATSRRRFLFFFLCYYPCISRHVASYIISSVTFSPPFILHTAADVSRQPCVVPRRHAAACIPPPVPRRGGGCRAGVAL